MNQVAIIVPVFNTAAYLRRCVDSLLGQSIGVDIVLVDDGSTDQSGALCDELSARPGVYVIHRTNGGLSAARNTGIDWVLANSSAEYLAFVDSDDWVSAQFAESMLKGCQLANCRVAAAAVAQTEGRFAFPVVAPKFEVFDVACYWRRSDLLFSIACAKLFHRSLFKDIRFPQGRLHEDEFTTHRLVFQERHIAVCATPLYAYFRHAGSITRTAWSDRRLDAVDGLRGEIAFFQEKGLAGLVDSERLRLVSTVLNLLGEAMREPSARAAVRRLRHVLREEVASIPVLDAALARRIEAALHPWRSRAIRFLKSISRYGIVEAVRLVSCGWSRRPQGIGLIAWWRFGLRNPRRLADGAGEVEVVLTMLWGGGATMYLERQLTSLTEGRIAFVVKPDAVAAGRLWVDVYRDGNRVGPFLVRSLAAFNRLQGHRIRIVVNELVQWHLYESRAELSSGALNRLVDAILRLKMYLAAELVFFVHDYYCVCPRFTLLSPQGIYCASEATCSHCGSCITVADYAPIPIALGETISAWRSAFGRLLMACDEVRTFSEDSGRRVEACFPGLRPTVVPHVPMGVFARLPKVPESGVTIGVFGCIHVAKGARGVVRLAKYLLSRGLHDVRIVVVGTLDTAGEMLPPNICVLGPYHREDLPDIIEREGINVAYLPSVCPETFSYMTQELVALGLPLVCHDLGAPHDHVANYPKGRVCPSFEADDVWDSINQVLRNRVRL